ARIVGALADHIGYALVAPEESHLVDEVTEELVKIRVGARAARTRAGAVAEDALICGQAVSLGVSQHLATVELVKRVGTRPPGEPNGTVTEQLLQLADHAKHTDSLVLIQVVDVANRNDPLGGNRLIVRLHARRHAGLTERGSRLRSNAGQFRQTL